VVYKRGKFEFTLRCFRSRTTVEADTLAELSALHHASPHSAGAVLNNLKPTPDSSIAIYGCGAVGMSAILAAAYLGVKTIIAVDIIPQRLTLAKEFGATHVVSGKSPTCVQDVRDITPYGAGTQYAVEASGNAKVLRMAYDALASFGHLTSCGTPGPGVPAPMGIHEHVTSGKVYSGTLMGNDDPNNVSVAPSSIAMHYSSDTLQFIFKLMLCSIMLRRRHFPV
jgi:aryl-alcohol dehydrogenase